MINNNITTIKIDAPSVAAMDLGPLGRYVEWSPNSQYFEGAPGQEHYRLIAYLSSQLPSGSLIVDIGTYHGQSAVAASFNENVKVVTYDIYDHLPNNKDTARNKPNIEIRVGNCLMDMEDIAVRASMVILDVDPHDGIQESEIVDSLIAQHGYKGMLLMDDVGLNKGMRDFYNDTVEKYVDSHGYRALDLTSVGHFSGTGMLFDPTTYDVSF